jgi:hypothetical protein
MHECICTSAWSNATAPITSIVVMVVALSTALATSGVCVEQRNNTKHLPWGL